MASARSGRTVDYLLIGGGLASATAAEEISWILVVIPNEHRRSRHPVRRLVKRQEARVHPARRWQPYRRLRR